MLILLIFLSVTLRGEIDNSFVPKRTDFFGNEIWRLNDWVSYDITQKHLVIHKKDYFDLSRTTRDSLEADGYKRLEILLTLKNN